MGRATAIKKGIRSLKDMMRKRRSPGRSTGPAGKTTKKPTAKQRQLEKLKDMRNKVMGTQKVMVAKKGGATSGALRKAIDFKNLKFAKPVTGRSAAAKKAAGSGITKATKTAMGKLRMGKGNPAGKDMSDMGRMTAIASAFMKRRKDLKGRSKKTPSPAREAFKRAKARKPSGRLTADDLRRATRRK